MSSRVHAARPDEQTSSDWVVREVAHGLRYHKLVIPLLLEGVDPERIRANLPDAIKGLADRNFFRVRIEDIDSLKRDCDTLARTIMQRVDRENLLRKGIFISYRRLDGDRLFPPLLSTQLEAVIGKGSTFIDRHMPAGETFPVELQKALETASVTVVVIGVNWIDLFTQPVPARNPVKGRQLTHKHIAAAGFALAIATGITAGLMNLDRKDRESIEVVREQERKSVLQIERAAAEAQVKATAQVKAAAEEAERRQAAERDAQRLKEEAAETERRAEMARRQQAEREDESKRARAAKAREREVAPTPPPAITSGTPRNERGLQPPAEVPTASRDFTAPYYAPRTAPPAHPGSIEDLNKSLGFVLGIGRHTMPSTIGQLDTFQIEPRAIPPGYGGGPVSPTPLPQLPDPRFDNSPRHSIRP